MKLHLSILEKLIELPTSDVNQLRHLLDELGLEVKAIEAAPGGGTVFNIETLAVRGDHLSALGMAREFAGHTLRPIKMPALVSELTDRSPSIPVKVRSELCLRYALLELSCSPRLTLRPEIAAVMGPLPEERHPIVAVLNYVQLELGQPMHAFDRDQIEGELVVDTLSAAEEIEALDGQRYTVPEGALVIRDRKKVVAVAGVIGCANSMATSSTERLLIESATFDPVSVRRTARAMGIATDASFTFERGADPEMVTTALRRVVYLVAGAGGMVKDSDGAHVLGYQRPNGDAPFKRTVRCTLSYLRAQLNSPRFADAEVTTRLKALGFQVTSTPLAKGDVEYSVEVPSWRRWDVDASAADIAEEVARAYGLAKVKAVLPPLDADLPEREPIDILRERLEPMLLGNGFFEVITKGFTSADDVRLLSRLAPKMTDRHIAILNSVEGSYSHMKCTNLLHLARLASANLRMGVLAVKAYEFGRLFQREARDGAPFAYERDTLSIAVAGRWYEHEWKRPEPLDQLVQLFTGVLESLLRAAGVTFGTGESTHPLLHPGYRASLKAGRYDVGFAGVLHPELRDALEIKHDVLYAEIDTGRLAELMRDHEVVEPSDFPMVRRDLTLAIPLQGRAGRILQLTHEMKLPHLQRAAIVDEFQKEGESFRRVTYRFTFQSGERTLAHEEVDRAMEQLVNTLRNEHSLELAP